MPIKKITQRILSDAKKEAAKIKKEAEAEAKKITQEYQNRAQELAQEITREAKKVSLAEKRRALALAHLESRDRLLAEKQAGLNSVFDGALKRLLSLPDIKYRQLIKKMLLKTVSLEGEVILSPQDRKRLGPSFIKEVNQTLKKRNNKGQLKLANETREIKGGFIIRVGRIEGNNSLDVLIAGRREELEPQVLQTLFPSTKKG